MAVEEKTDADNEVAVTQKKGNGVMKIILIVVVLVVLIIGSIGATLYFSGVLGGNDKVDQATDTDISENKTEIIQKKEKGTTIYFPFEPSFVVNFSDGKSIRFLQLTIEIMTYEEAVIEDVKKHMPVIRNNLIMMLSNLNYEVINSVAGKRKLQNEALMEIRSILLEKTGREGVEEVYFTGFVMQ